MQPFLKVIDVIIDQANVKDELGPITILCYPLLLLSNVNSINYFQKKNWVSKYSCDGITFLTYTGRNTCIDLLIQKEPNLKNKH